MKSKLYADVIGKNSWNLSFENWSVCLCRRNWNTSSYSITKETTQFMINQRGYYKREKIRMTRKSTHRCASPTWLSWLYWYFDNLCITCAYYLICRKFQKHLTHWSTDNLKSRDANASKKLTQKRVQFELFCKLNLSQFVKLPSQHAEFSSI